MPERKTTETAFGSVDEKALEALQNSFHTRRLLAAVDAVDQIRARINGLRDDLLDLHRMAAEVINEDYGSRPAREEPIWEVAEMLASEMLDSRTGCVRRTTQSKSWSRSPPARTGMAMRSEDNYSYTLSSVWTQRITLPFCQCIFGKTERITKHALNGGSLLPVSRPGRTEPAYSAQLPERSERPRNVV
jgi:hypothetical protein